MSLALTVVDDSGTTSGDARRPTSGPHRGDEWIEFNAKSAIFTASQCEENRRQMKYQINPTV